MEIPKEIKSIIGNLKENGFEAYLVGGCVRDFLRGVEPDDWDAATNAKPEQISRIFPKNFSDNNFGTVTALTDSENPALKEVEITPYRIDEKYSDKRHPDSVSFVKTIEEDLARRDFTINAMALDLNSKLKIIDPFEGQKDLGNKIIRAVRNPEERFSEDALRMLRAVRFAAVFGFEIEKETAEAIKKNSPWLQAISKERIRDEFMKIIITEKAAFGLEILRDLGLLKFIIPELEEGYKIEQNKHHVYDCYEHAYRSLDYAAKQGFDKYVRFAALLHDIGKPRSKQGQGQNSTFYNHEIIGAKMAYQILNRLRFPKKEAEKIVKLVRYHLFYYNVDEVGAASVRRLVRNVGPENVEELLQVRMADRIGSGVPKAEPYKLRHLKYLMEKVGQDPISVKMLKVGGEEVMNILGIRPGPKIGWVLEILLDYVLIDPRKNKKDFLEKEIKKLGKLSEKELSFLAGKAKEEKEKIETKKDQMTKRKYWVT